MLHQPFPNREGKARLTAPLWTATAAPGPRLAPLSGDVETDVLVIGGGIAGLSTALHLAEAGVDVLLLERGQPGDGATGQSGGLVAPDYIRHTPETIRDVLGSADGERMTRMIGRSAQQLFDLIERHGITCEARQDGFFTPAHSEALAESQRGVANQWRSRGHNVSFVEGTATRRSFGAERYCGALHFADGGSINPLAYVRGLAAAAAAKGARLFADTPVDALVQEGGRWIARTAIGSVSARRVVLAANGGNADLHPALRKTALPLHVFQFASAPLSGAARQVILPRGGAFTDKRPYLFTARRDPAGHLVSAFPMSYLVRGPRGCHREAKRRLAQHFAVLPDPRIDYLWHGTAWVNTSFLPEIYDLGNSAIAIQACNGRGIATNSTIGAEVAAWLASGDEKALSVRPRAPSPVAFYRGAAMLPKILMSMARLSN
ncbi:MAG: FAD-binding oxidoreductase [Sphingopyxis sp.]|uniref:NAD(P)/FAD-dependent oxidoreductase n=1 Tax=Sphingopyxis sp. TaxID=1908224 RepID=UPI002ABCD53F|nr:FAD-binding oxidoreductase [Sphingopyxis sp.]MDZ3831636.1 FAD-binding oxidoreductase [Sphingopyxis sp.]